MQIQADRPLTDAEKRGPAMKNQRIVTVGLLVLIPFVLAGCGKLGGGEGGLFGGGLFKGASSQVVFDTPQLANATAGTPPPVRGPQASTTGRGFLGIGRSQSVAGTQVNAHLWAAALDVLYYLPIQSADPYSGIIEPGYGSAPGSNRAYRGTILVQSAALDATSLNLALFTRSGKAPDATIRAVSDAIMQRARELRRAEDK